MNARLKSVRRRSPNVRSVGDTIAFSAGNGIVSGTLRLVQVHPQLIGEIGPGPAQGRWHVRPDAIDAPLEPGTQFGPWTLTPSSMQ